MSRIYVLRIGHRIHRDLRVSTHCALVAHAFGADGIIFSGDRDGDMIEDIGRTIQRWGGLFTVEYDSDWRGRIASFKMARGFVVHLTMYGINLPDIIEKVRCAFREGNILIVAGSQKVPPDVYRMADANVAVTNLPHSEVASISTILDWIFEGKELSRQLPRARMRIMPQERGKKVVKDI